MIALYSDITKTQKRRAIEDESGFKTPPNYATDNDDAASCPEDISEQSEKEGDKSEGGEESVEGEKEDGDEGGSEDYGSEDASPERKRKYVKRGRREWSELGFFDNTSMLESEIETAILQIATEKMNESNLFEWPEIKRANKKKTISLWVQRENYYKAAGNTHVETYYCPLRFRCGCDVQLRICIRGLVQLYPWTGRAVRIRMNCAIRRKSRSF